MKKIIDRILYDTDGEGVQCVATHETEFWSSALYAGKNLSWFSWFRPKIANRLIENLRPLTRNEVIDWLESAGRQDLLDRFFPIEEA